MMKPRKRPGTPCLSMQLDILFARGLVICGICGRNCQWDHVHEWADGGKHRVDNQRPVHDKPCHRNKSAVAVNRRAHIDRLRKPKRARNRPTLASRPLRSRSSHKPEARAHV
jgi:hypothetical protein